VATAVIVLPGKVVSVLKTPGAKRATVNIEILDRSAGGYGTGDATPSLITIAEDANAITDAFTPGAACTIRISQP